MVKQIKVRTRRGEIDFKRQILNIPYTCSVERLVRILKMLDYWNRIVRCGFGLVVGHNPNRFDLDHEFANTLVSGTDN